VHKFLGFVLVPLMRVWDAIVERGLAEVPRPTDEPRSHPTGIDCDRVLIFGRGLALGLGVLSHEIALSGSLARALSDQTGHGVDVTVVAESTITVGSAIQRLGHVRLDRFDAIVITFGARDAAILTPLRRWEARMGALLRFLDDHCLLTAHIFVLGIQPVRSIRAFDSPLGTIAARHAHTLNAATARMCSEVYGTIFVPLTATPAPAPGRFRSAADYRHWGEILADEMAGPLTAERLYADALEWTHA
jgi:hypothetical protein